MNVCSRFWRIQVLLTLLCIAPAALAGTVGKIAGRVTDAETGEAIIGAAVQVEGTTAGAAADLNGDYFILNVQPGAVTLRATAIGYAPNTVQGVQVISDQTSTVNFQLAPESVQGEEVVIVAERRLVEMDRTFATSTVAADDIGALPVTNLSQVIDLQAGVVDGHFRGGRSNEVLYLVDGVSVTDVYNNSQGTQVDDAVVEELQVISGTFNAEYGQAMSGVVNIVTKEGGSEFHGSVSAEVGDYISNHDQTFMNIDDVSPTAIQDYAASLFGPVPYIPRLSFFVSGRFLRDSGWLYGRNRWALEWPIVPTDSGLTALPTPGDNGFFEMNRNWETFGHAKLSYDLSSRIRLSYTNLYSSRNYRDYDHDWKFVPSGTLRRYQDGRTSILKINHALGGSAFYEAGLTHMFTEYEHYLYEDPFDPRYAHPQYADFNPPYTLNVAGNNLNRFRRFTQTNQAMANINWQVTRLHLLKAGFDVKLHELFYEDVNLVPLNPNQIFDPTGENRTMIFDPTIADVSDPSHDRFLNNPYELAVYVQDKFELPALIVNAGLRFDYFEPDGQVLRDPKDPNVYYPLLAERAAQTLGERLSYWYKDATPKYRISPRLGIAYPMSDVGVFHFAYGHFVQRPTFERMYANPEYELESGVGLNTVMGNPDLKMEETTTYEFGFQQEIAEDVALNTTIFYRDIRNLVATDRIVETYSSGTKYSQYVNRSFGEVKGLTLSLDKRLANNFSAFMDYTYQVAKGDASDPQSAFNDLKGNNPREPQRQLVPLNWDRRHTLNASVTYMTMNPSGWGATLLAKYGSGLPYSPVEQGIRTGFENDARRPSYYNLDLSAFKNFPIPNSPRRLVLILTVQNVLDTRNEDNVYASTGRAGYSQERNRATEVIYQGQAINSLDEVFINPTFYSRPRMVRLGARFEF